jgi:Xaa-Pro aminopeptidase
MWEGVRYGVEGAREIFNADEAFEIGDLEKKLPDLLESVEQVYFRLGMHPEHDRKVMEALASVKSKFGRSGKGLLPIFDAGQVIGEMRLFKDPTEIESLRKAAKVSSRAHNMAMEQVKPEMNEFDIEALIEYQFKRGGCRRLGYGSIVAGGKNATCLHYTYNNEVLKDGDLLLIDAGGEFDYYTADITRTFPVSKKFSTAQAKVYDLVLKSQKEAISKVKPGMKFQDLHKGVCEALLEGMLSLGVLSGDKNDLLEKNAFRRFYPHGTSHFLGMDVHDAGLYKTNGEEFRLLEPGMVFTVEPGFYVQPVDKDAPAEFRDIGIRIEDNILVTEKGFENLTESAVKERDAIEALRGA